MKFLAATILIASIFLDGIAAKSLTMSLYKQKKYSQYLDSANSQIKLQSFGDDHSIKLAFTSPQEIEYAFLTIKCNSKTQTVKKVFLDHSKDIFINYQTFLIASEGPKSQTCDLSLVWKEKLSENEQTKHFAKNLIIDTVTKKFKHVETAPEAVKKAIPNVLKSAGHVALAVGLVFTLVQYELVPFTPSLLSIPVMTGLTFQMYLVYRFYTNMMVYEFVPRFLITSCLTAAALIANLRRIHRLRTDSIKKP